jgi:kynurenine 3-monooxygenase
MRGRMIHPLHGTPSLQPYGRRPNEVIYSVSRHRLNQVLLDVAARRSAIDMRFDHRLETLDFTAAAARLRGPDGRTVAVPMHPLLAADGAASAARRGMASQGLIRAEEIDLDHGYKELSIPADHGRYPMEREALHIWPRGDFMLIALPNADGSLTATLFLPKHGDVSFEALGSPAAVERFLHQHFPDALALMPHAAEEFAAHPTGFLGTVYADRWNVGGSAVLVGDAAHAIVPFHGQGMNCCFEDCVAFDTCLARETDPGRADWRSVFERFVVERKTNTDAIAAMALDNYLEMRERVADPRFRLQQMLALELERRHPARFIPRYSMVMFHHEIPYRTALDRGAVQSRMLAALTEHAASLDDIDYGLAGQMIDRDLPPLIPEGDPPSDAARG